MQFVKKSFSWKAGLCLCLRFYGVVTVNPGNSGYFLIFFGFFCRLNLEASCKSNQDVERRREEEMGAWRIAAMPRSQLLPMILAWSHIHWWCKQKTGQGETETNPHCGSFALFNFYAAVCEDPSDRQWYRKTLNSLHSDINIIMTLWKSKMKWQSNLSDTSFWNLCPQYRQGLHTRAVLRANYTRTQK